MISERMFAAASMRTLHGSGAESGRRWGRRVVGGVGGGRVGRTHGVDVVEVVGVMTS